MSQSVPTNKAAEDKFSNPLLQVYFDTPEKKNDKATGKEIAKRIYQQNTTDNSNLTFFKARVARWVELLKWAKGSQDLTQFLDYMNVSDANKSWVNIPMTQTRIAPQFVGTLVQSMAKTNEYPSVDAIDDGSLNEKEDRFLEALHRMYNADKIAAAQEKTGMQIEPANVFVPDDELSAKVHFELEDRLPKEIRFQQMLQRVLLDNQYEKVLKHKSLFYLIVLNIGITKIDRDAKGNYLLKMPLPQNTVYNFFISATGKEELGYIGELYSLKIRDLRSLYGKSETRPDGLTEEQIFLIAKSASQKNVSGTFQWQWNVTYNFSLTRPWDEFSIPVFDFEINCGEDEYYVSKEDQYGRENIKAKKGMPDPKSENAKIIKNRKNTWYRGVFAVDSDMMLYWGLPDLKISPYLDTFKSFSSYSINIPFNDGEYVPSLFERIMEPLKEYQLTKLKRKQLIAKVRPSGIRIDVESARNIDLGQGDSIPWEEVVRIFDQTGNELWSSRGVNPNEREAPPISNTVQDVTIQKIMELTNVLAGITQEIRSLIGVSMYRDGSDVGDRTAARLAEGQNAASYNVTDFIQNGHQQLWEETLNKLCILKWNDIVTDKKESADDLLNTRFNVNVKMKATDYERQILEQDIANWSKVIDESTGMPLLSPKDAFRIRNIDDFKLAEMYLTNTIQENYRKSQADKAAREKANLESQRATAQDASKAAQVLEQQKQAFKQMELNTGTKDVLIKGMLDIYKTALASTAPTPDNPGGKPLQIPEELKPLFDSLITNVATPLLQENQAQQQQEEEQQEDPEEQMAEGPEGEQMEGQQMMQ